MAQLTKEELEVRLISAVDSMLMGDNDNVYMGGYVQGLQTALGIMDEEMLRLVRNNK